MCEEECEKAAARRTKEAEERKDEISKASREGWQKCADGLRAHDENLAKLWKEEIDALLVFVSVVLWILTAFLLIDL